MELWIDESYLHLRYIRGGHLSASAFARETPTDKQPRYRLNGASRGPERETHTQNNGVREGWLVGVLWYRCKWSLIHGIYLPVATVTTHTILLIVCRSMRRTWMGAEMAYTLETASRIG